MTSEQFKALFDKLEPALRKATKALHAQVAACDLRCGDIAESYDLSGRGFGFLVSLGQGHGGFGSVVVALRDASPEPIPGFEEEFPAAAVSTRASGPNGDQLFLWFAAKTGRPEELAEQLQKLESGRFGAEIAHSFEQEAERPPAPRG